MTMTIERAYALLGCEPGASREEIRACYWARARETHPDQNPGDPTAHERFCAVATAHDLVTNYTSPGRTGTRRADTTWRDTRRSWAEEEPERWRRWQEHLERIRIERAAEFKRRARNFGLRPEHLGKQFSLGGRRYTIAGLSGVAGQSILCESEGSFLRFRADFVRFALEISDGRDARAHVAERMAEEAAVHFMRHCGRHGLNVDDLGRWFLCDGVRYQVRGLKPRARRAPIRCSTEEGKIRHFPVATIRYALEQATEGEDVAARGERLREEQERAHFLEYAADEGLAPSDLDAQFRHGHRLYTICGLHRPSRVYRIVARDERGTRYRFSAVLVLRLLGRW